MISKTSIFLAALCVLIAAGFCSVGSHSQIPTRSSGGSAALSASPRVSQTRPEKPADRRVLISELPVSLSTELFAVNESETAFAVAGDTAMVVELEVPSCKYLMSWNLPEAPSKLFTDGDRYLAIIDKEIISLTSTGQEVIGAVPTEANTFAAMPEGCVLRRRARPLSCNNGNILWSGENRPLGSLRDPRIQGDLILLWTDVSGKPLKVVQGEDLSEYEGCRVTPGGRWTLSKGKDCQWLMTLDGCAELPAGGTLVTLGHTGFALAFDGYRDEYDAATGEVVRRNEPLQILPNDPSKREAGYYLTPTGCRITDSGRILQPDGKPDPRQDLRLVSRDREYLYLADGAANRFVRACIETDTVERFPCDGVPLYLDAEIRVAYKDNRLFVNGREVEGLDLANCPADPFRKGDLLVTSSRTPVLVNLRTNSRLDSPRSYLAIFGDSAILLFCRPDGDETFMNPLLVAINPHDPDQKATIPVGSHWGSYLQIGTGMFECRRHEHADILVKMYEILPGYSTGALQFRELPEGTAVPLPANHMIDLWPKIPFVTDGEGRDCVLPPVVRGGSFLFGGWRGTSEFPAFAEYGGALFIQCGANFLSLDEAE